RVGGSGNFGTSATITPSAGNVAPTSVEVRFSPTAGGTFSDTIQISSPGAFTNQLLVSGEGLSNPTVEFIGSSKSYLESSGTDSIGVKIVNKGSNTIVVDLVAQTGV